MVATQYDHLKIMFAIAEAWNGMFFTNLFAKCMFDMYEGDSKLFFGTQTCKQAVSFLMGVPIQPDLRAERKL